MSNFSYCPLIWMFCGKLANSQMNLIHKRALSALYNDNSASYSELLIIGGHDTIHQNNMKFLVKEVHKSVNRLNPTFMRNICTTKEVRYNLRLSDLLSIHHASTYSYGLHSFTFRGSITWNKLPDTIKNTKNLATLVVLKTSIIPCTCKICKTF